MHLWGNITSDSISPLRCSHPARRRRCSRWRNVGGCGISISTLPPLVVQFVQALRTQPQYYQVQGEHHCTQHTTALHLPLQFRQENRQAPTSALGQQPLQLQSIMSALSLMDNLPARRTSFGTFDFTHLADLAILFGGLANVWDQPWRTCTYYTELTYTGLCTVQKAPIYSMLCT